MSACLYPDALFHDDNIARFGKHASNSFSAGVWAFGDGEKWCPKLFVFHLLTTYYT